MQWVLVAIGAACGGMLRLAFVPLNHSGSSLPWGTLLANLLGGMLMGVVLGVNDRLSPEWRWLLATGFLGGLTTFSTFSAETVKLLQQGLWSSALLLVALHVLGSLAMTLLGCWLMQRVLGS